MSDKAKKVETQDKLRRTLFMIRNPLVFTHLGFIVRTERCHSSIVPVDGREK